MKKKIAEDEAAKAAKRGDMQFLGVKLVYVVLAAVATMAVGFLWYSPLLFAKPWMSAMGYDPNDKAGLEEMRKGAGKLYGAAGQIVKAA